jgi:ribonuclease P/MRP protein subunit RPP40
VKKPSPLSTLDVIQGHQKGLHPRLRPCNGTAEIQCCDYGSPEVHGSGLYPQTTGQWIVLGPCLFSVYIDDLEGELKQRRLDVLIKKFADDTKGAKVIKGPEDRIKMQEALDCLCDWADRWGMTMSFNFSKCKVMHVGKKNPRYEYFMRGTQVSTTEEERDVGVLISSNLKPSAQCSKAACSAKSVLKQLQRNFHYRDRITFLKLYKQYVQPHLEFSVPAWSPWLAGDREVLEKVQEKAVKMVTGLKAVS